MRKEAFEGMLESAGRLTAGQRKVLVERLLGLETGHGSGREVERVLPESPPCPSCGSGQCCRWGHMSGLQRFRCKAC